MHKGPELTPGCCSGSSVPCISNRGCVRREKRTTEQGKRSLSEFIKYQGNIAGTGSVSRAGALVPLITTDKKPGAVGGGGREGSSARDSGSDYRTGSKRSGAGGVEGKTHHGRGCKVQVPSQRSRSHNHRWAEELRDFESRTGVIEERVEHFGRRRDVEAGSLSLSLSLCVPPRLPHLYEPSLWLNSKPEQEESGRSAVTECRPYISVGLTYFLFAPPESPW